jgi:hypothetical protein
LFIAFTPPAFDGGLTITNYEYAVSSNSGSTYGSFTALSPVDATSPVTIPGLTNGTAYYVKLRAVNALGVGTESSPVTTNTTPYGNPVATTGSGSDTTAAANTPTTNAPTSVESFATVVTVPFYSSSGTWQNPYPAGQATGTGTLNGSAGTTSFIWGTSSGSYPNEVSATSNAYVRTTWPRGTTVYYKAKTSNSSCAVQFNGTVNANGNSTTVTFEYGTVSGVYTNTVTATQSPVTGTSNTSVSATVTGLTAGTYYFRVKAVNATTTPTYGDQGSVSIAVATATAASQQSFTPPAVTTLYELLAVGGGGGLNSGGSGGGGGAGSYYSSAAAPTSLAWSVGDGGADGSTGTQSYIIFTGGAGISMFGGGGAIGAFTGYDFGGNSGVATGGTTNYPATAFTGGQGGNIGDSDYGYGGGAGAGGNGSGYSTYETSSMIYAYGGHGGPGVTINFPLGGSVVFGAGGGGYGTDYAYPGPGPSIGNTAASDYGRGGFKDASYNSNYGTRGLVRFRYYGP